MRVRKRQSIMSQPTFIKMPASTAWGIGSVIHPMPRTNASRMAERKTPETGVRPPARILTTVPMVAPAPGRPPISPAAKLPMPWPTNSRLGLWVVRVRASATSEVSRLSIEPRSARMNAGSKKLMMMPGASTGHWSWGRPAGTAPMTGAEPNQMSASSVPAIRAARGAGRYLRSLRGQKTFTARATAPTTRASRLRRATASGQARMELSGPPDTALAPMNGRT